MLTTQVAGVCHKLGFSRPKGFTSTHQHPTFFVLSFIPFLQISLGSITYFCEPGVTSYQILVMDFLSDILSSLQVWLTGYSLVGPPFIFSLLMRPEQRLIWRFSLGAQCCLSLLQQRLHNHQFLAGLVHFSASHQASF